jgi:hypothetical protein
MKIKGLNICSILLALTFACSGINPEEELYKKNAIELSKLQKDFLNIKINPRGKPFPDDNKIIFDYDTEERETFLKNTEEKWLSVSKNFKQIALEYPDSKWADDAAFCRAMGFAFIRTPISSFNKEKVSTIRDFLGGYRQFQIEGWTKERFERFYGVFFSSLPIGQRRDLGEAEAIRGGLYLLLISHFKVQNETKEAEEEIEKLRAEGLNPYFLHTAQRLIDNDTN